MNVNQVADPVEEICHFILIWTIMKQLSLFMFNINS